MTPKPWAVVLINNNNVDFNVHRRTAEASGITYIQTGRAVEYTGQLGEDTQVFWCDDRPTAEAVIVRAQESYPKNSYALCQTQMVSYIPAAPPQRAAFGPAGLLPI